MHRSSGKVAHIQLPRSSRNWFLERVLKLGLTPLAKEYQCVGTHLRVL